jgi:pimeloyl-ACP methyl ester carboxylesterase
MSQTSSAARTLKTVAAIYGAICLAGGVVLAEVSLRLDKQPVSQDALERIRLRRKFEAEVEDVTINAADGIILRGWFIQPPQPNGKSVILLHGITSNRTGSTPYADMFLARGYSVLVPDSREHGESGGEIATYGVLERHDVNLWVAWLRHRVPGCTFLLGESMGAAIGLQAAAVTPDLCAIAVEAPFANFRQISYERLGRKTSTGALFWQTLGRPILEVALLYTRVRYGIYLPDADPLAAVEHSKTPTLLIAGVNDRDIPMHHSEELAQACDGHCNLWVVPGGEHADAATFAHDEFEKRVLDFFDQHAAVHGSDPKSEPYNQKVERPRARTQISVAEDSLGL